MFTKSMMIQNHTLDIIAASLLEKNLCLYNALVMTGSSVQKEHQEPSCVRQLMQKGNFWKPPADCRCLFFQGQRTTMNSMAAIIS